MLYRKSALSWFYPIRGLWFLDKLAAIERTVGYFEGDMLVDQCSIDLVAKIRPVDQETEVRSPGRCRWQS